MKKIIFAFFLLNSSVWASDVRLISVSGLAERSQRPDLARIQVSVWGKAESAKNAQNLASEQQDHFKKVLEQFDVKKDDVSTTGYDLTPEYSYDNKNNTNKIVGYTAAQSIRITLKNTEPVGKFLDALIKDEKNLKSGTSVLGVGWDLEKREEIERSLLTEAVKNAEEEAQLLAKAARVKIKSVYHLTPQKFSSPVPMYQADALMMKSAGVPKETSVFAGEIKVKAQVSADYEIE